ncbi:MAG: lipid-A-disaccharide synthase N-terminal domain-containing protein [Phycisphaerae bacterium]
MVIGFVGQFIFGLRFVVQWIATELRKRSVVPVAFWYLSLVGTVVLLAYSIYQRDPVFIAGFSLNMIIYLRNLHFVRRDTQQKEAIR